MPSVFDLQTDLMCLVQKVSRVPGTVWTIARFWRCSKKKLEREEASKASFRLEGSGPKSAVVLS
jgi:hypothetical protein